MVIFNSTEDILTVHQHKRKGRKDADKDRWSAHHLVYTSIHIKLYSNIFNIYLDNLLVNIINATSIVD